jgi:hypothetical protein
VWTFLERLIGRQPAVRHGRVEVVRVTGQEEPAQQRRAQSGSEYRGCRVTMTDVGRPAVQADRFVEVGGIAGAFEAAVYHVGVRVEVGGRVFAGSAPI